MKNTDVRSVINIVIIRSLSGIGYRVYRLSVIVIAIAADRSSCNKIGSRKSEIEEN